MEAAKLVLEYLRVLIWPLLLLGLLIWFRAPLKALWRRLERETRQLDVDIGGQKISVKLAERVLDEAVDAAVRSGAPSIHTADRIRNESRALLEVLSHLTQQDIQIIRILPAPATRLPDHAAAKLVSLEVAVQHAGTVEATDLGRRVSALVGPTGNVDEALHKIAQAM